MKQALLRAALKRLTGPQHISGTAAILLAKWDAALPESPVVPLSLFLSLPSHVHGGAAGGCWHKTPPDAPVVELDRHAVRCMDRTDVEGIDPDAICPIEPVRLGAEGSPPSVKRLSSGPFCVT